MKESLLLLPSSLRLLYTRIYAGPSPFKRETSRKAIYCGPDRTLFSLGNYTNVTCCSFNPKEQFARRYHDNKCHNRNKLSQYIVVRSELTGTGTLDAAYPLPAPGLGSKVRGICFYAVTAAVAIFLFVLMLVEVEGLENLPAPNTPAVYVSNHQSFLDIYTLLTLGRSFKFISKTSIFIFPVVGWAMFLMGLIPLRRMDSRSQLDCLKRCMDLVKKGASVFFFPEGTRSKDGKLGAFKEGAFSIAANTKVPVVPITIIGIGKIMPSGREGILNPGSVRIVIHKPIEGNNADMLCNEARNVIAVFLVGES
ncbi:1-acyl-sn-glycerol-3-phosphate acyltransferase LPAT1, chloroplastic-like isoform X2 [Actinidia eriantha]|uniref:1-acyl-sn-glycerol-3-phosphate acyltransferase LPAT1, chloroplastic-like isoform X2 n=1 Tax=Actinidia eriantha TaxID=165200 RepID=UPI002583211C|nr:1-acyl-sn-glycerol-3-phosphate acyltransferase LPAT1, chloroplastic-like isoform X2 [Actinidia eriantha]